MWVQRLTRRFRVGGTDHVERPSCHFERARNLLDTRTAIFATSIRIERRGRGEAPAATAEGEEPILGLIRFLARAK